MENKKRLCSVKEIFPTISLLKFTTKKRSQYCTLQPSDNNRRHVIVQVHSRDWMIFPGQEFTYAGHGT